MPAVFNAPVHRRPQPGTSKGVRKPIGPFCFGNAPAGFPSAGCPKSGYGTIRRESRSSSPPAVPPPLPAEGFSPGEDPPRGTPASGTPGPFRLDLAPVRPCPIPAPPALFRLYRRPRCHSAGSVLPPPCFSEAPSSYKQPSSGRARGWYTNRQKPFGLQIRVKRVNTVCRPLQDCYLPPGNGPGSFIVGCSPIGLFSADLLYTPLCVIDRSRRSGSSARLPLAIIKVPPADRVPIPAKGVLPSSRSPRARPQPLVGASWMLQKEAWP